MMRGQSYEAREPHIDARCAVFLDLPLVNLATIQASGFRLVLVDDTTPEEIFAEESHETPIVPTTRGRSSGTDLDSSDQREHPGIEQAMTPGADEGASSSIYDIAGIRRRLGARFGLDLVTYDYVAHLVGVSHQTVMSWERLERRTRAAFYARLLAIDEALAAGTFQGPAPWEIPARAVRTNRRNGVYFDVRGLRQRLGVKLGLDCPVPYSYLAELVRVRHKSMVLTWEKRGRVCTLYARRLKRVESALEAGDLDLPPLSEEDRDVIRGNNDMRNNNTSSWQVAARLMWIFEEVFIKRRSLASLVQDPSFGSWNVHPKTLQRYAYTVRDAKRTRRDHLRAAAQFGPMEDGDRQELELLESVDFDAPISGGSSTSSVPVDDSVASSSTAETPTDSAPALIGGATPVAIEKEDGAGEQEDEEDADEDADDEDYEGDEDDDEDEDEEDEDEEDEDADEDDDEEAVDAPYDASTKQNELLPWFRDGSLDVDRLCASLGRGFRLEVTREMLAAHTGILVEELHDWERGVRKPSPYALSPIIDLVLLSSGRLAKPMPRRFEAVRTELLKLREPPRGTKFDVAAFRKKLSAAAGGVEIPIRVLKELSGAKSRNTVENWLTRGSQPTRAYLKNLQQAEQALAAGQLGLGNLLAGRRLAPKGETVHVVHASRPVTPPPVKPAEKVAPKQSQPLADDVAKMRLARSLWEERFRNHDGRCSKGFLEWARVFTLGRIDKPFKAWVLRALVEIWEIFGSFLGKNEDDAEKTVQTLARIGWPKLKIILPITQKDDSHQNVRVWLERASKLSVEELLEKQSSIERPQPRTSSLPTRVWTTDDQTRVVSSKAGSNGTAVHNGTTRNGTATHKSYYVALPHDLAAAASAAAKAEGKSRAEWVRSLVRDELERLND